MIKKEEIATDNWQVTFLFELKDLVNKFNILCVEFMPIIWMYRRSNYWYAMQYVPTYTSINKVEEVIYFQLLTLFLTNWLKVHNLWTKKPTLKSRSKIFNFIRMRDLLW